jgi:cytochrome b561
MTNAALRFSLPTQIFHWLTVLCVLAAWTLGLLGDELPRGPIRHAGEFTHVILGELVVILLALRVVWRFVAPAPAPEPTRFGTAGDIAAKALQLALYGLLLAVPAVGLVTLFHGGEPLSLFGVYDIPSPWPKNRELKHNSKEIHEFLAHLLVALAMLHAAAALVHHYLFKDDTLRRMLPAAALPGRRS